MYDVIVIGAGIAGLTSSIFCARAGLKTLIIGDIKKSMLADGEKVGNYLGFVDVPGIEILEKGLKQAMHYGAEYMNQEVVHSLQLEETNSFMVKTADAKTYETKSLIIATGTSYKESGAEGEKDFKGKGVHYCVSCDGFFYKGKRVAVLGESNLAAEEAIELTALTDKVTLISQRMEFEISDQMMGELEKNKVKMIKGNVIKIVGKERVDHLELEDGSRIDIDAVFVAMGTATGVDFSNKLGIIMDDEFIQVDRSMKTNLVGVFAAGSCTGGIVQAAKSAGDGCNAAISTIKFVKGIGEYVDQT